MDANQVEIAQNFTSLKKQGLENAPNGNPPYNPLIQAANCFFDATKHPELQKIGAIQQQLLDNLDTFQRIVLHYYAEAVALMSIYILCFTLDTLMAYRLEQYHEQWTPHNLVMEMFQYKDATSLTRMLDAIDFLCLSEDADTHLLEFAYVCMSLAVKNNEHTNAATHHRANVSIDRLYKKIYEARAGFQTHVTLKPQVPKNVTKTHANALPAWLIIVLTLVVIFTVFSVMTFLFNITTKHTLEHLKPKRSVHVTHEEIITH